VNTIFPAGVEVSTPSVEADKLDAERLERHKGPLQVRHGSREAIELPDAHHVKLPRVSIRHQPIELWPLLLGAGNPDVHVLLDYRGRRHQIRCRCGLDPRPTTDH
jgi:hypothetical protein